MNDNFPPIEVREADAQALDDELKADRQDMYDQNLATVAELEAAEHAGNEEVQKVRDGDISLNDAEAEIVDVVEDAMRRVDDAKLAFGQEGDDEEFGEPVDTDDSDKYDCDDDCNHNHDNDQ